MNLVKLSEIVGKYNGLFERVTLEKNQIIQDLELQQQKTIIIDSSKNLFSTLLDISREDIQHKISNLVTLALCDILDDPHFQMQLEFDFKRNQPEAVIVINHAKVRGELQETFGGGVEDVVSTVLKLVFAQLLDIEGPIWIDEPGKWIDDESSVRFAKFLNKLSHKFNRQLLLITHKSDIQNVADNVICVYQENGVSNVDITL